MPGAGRARLGLFLRAGGDLHRSREALALERGAHGVVHRVEHGLLLRELHLGLRGVHVHVHGAEGERQIQHAGRELADEERVFIRLLQRGLEGGGFDDAAVAVKMLGAAVAAPRGGRGDVALDLHAVGPAGAEEHARRLIAAEQAVDTGLHAAVTGGEKLLLPVADAPDGNVRAAERAPERREHTGAALGAVGLHEFQTGGRVIEQVADDHRRALGAAGLVHLLDLTGRERHARAARRALLTGQELHMAHGGDGRKRLAAKAERGDALEPARVAQLARRMAQKGDARVLGRHAAAVVRDAQIRHAAAADLHRDGARAGVDRVFDKLLHHRGGPLHDLTRGDQIRHVGGEYLDVRHGNQLL